MSPASEPNPNLDGHKLLVLLPWNPKPAYLEGLRKAHPGLKVVHHKLQNFRNDDLPSDLPKEAWKDVTILLTWELFPTPEMAPNCQYVQLLSAGCNHIINEPLFLDGNTAFCTANGVHPPQIAEWVFSTFLAYQHHIPEYIEAMKDGNWIASETDEDVEDSVGLRVGIFGYGCIGRQVASVARALGMEVYAYTNRPRLTAEARRDESYTEPGMGDPEGSIPARWFSGTSTEEVNEFLSQGFDLLVLAAPLTQSTRNLISKPQFEILAKKKTYISNVGRGPIVNTDDLIDALDRGLIRGAALDVTDPEPLPNDHPLWHKKNVIITPHVSGNSNHYNERVLAILKYNLERLSKGLPVVNRVNKELGY